MGGSRPPSELSARDGLAVSGFKGAGAQRWTAEYRTGLSSRGEQVLARSSGQLLLNTLSRRSAASSDSCAD